LVDYQPQAVDGLVYFHFAAYYFFHFYGYEIGVAVQVLAEGCGGVCYLAGFVFYKVAYALRDGQGFFALQHFGHLGKGVVFRAPGGMQA
jgi:hypothetical protein